MSKVASKIAITGIGIVSSLGTGVEKVARALKDGKSGVVFEPERIEMGFRSGLTGRIDDFEPPELSRKKRKTLTEFGLHSYAAALEAIEMAGWDEEALHDDRTGLIVGNDSSGLEYQAVIDRMMSEKSTHAIGSGLAFKAMISTISMNLSSLLGIRGGSWTLSGACASGGHAIGQGAQWILLDRQDRMLCGAAQEVNWQFACSFDALNAFSNDNDNPEGASRPFDAGRMGLVPSGGAAMVVLERLDRARERGAPVLAVLESYAFSSDGANLSVPSGEGLERCMRLCLQYARREPGEIDYICAHATSTPVGDAAEAGAIRNLFGDPGPHVSSLKSMTGHELWMAGASQAVSAVLMGRDGFIAPNRNFERQADGDPPIRVVRETLDEKPKTILCNSAGFGGTNSCLLISTEV